MSDAPGMPRPETGREPLLRRLDRIDRRWIFLLMAIAVAGPIVWVGVTGQTFPEKPSGFAPA